MRRLALAAAFGLCAATPAAADHVYGDALIREGQPVIVPSDYATEPRYDPVVLGIAAVLAVVAAVSFSSN